MNEYRLIDKRLEQLNRERTIKNYFNIIHNDNDNLFCEYTKNGYNFSVTYNECRTLSIKMGLYFKQYLFDVPKGSFVGLMMENRLEFITSFYGLLMAGFKPMLLNLKLNDELNNQIIDRLNIQHVICDKDYLVNASLINVNDINLNKVFITNNEFDWEDEFAISTSATSLNIKICVYNGENVSEQINNMKGIFQKNNLCTKGYKGQIKHLGFLPFYHIFGLMAEYFWFILVNSSFVFIESLSSDVILKTIRDYHITHIFAVPILWNAVVKSLVKEVETKDDKTKEKFYNAIKLSNTLQSANSIIGKDFARRAFGDIRKKIFGDSPTFLVSGGSDIPQETIRIINGLGYSLFNGYGMSEIGITSVELSNSANVRNLASIGEPFMNAQYKISDEGNLLVKSKGICHKIITKDSEIIIDHNEYFNTGDFAKCIKNRYYIQGRTDDIVLTENGEKINPALIEKELHIKHVERLSVLGIKENDKLSLSLLLEIDKNINKENIKGLINSVSENLNLLKDFNYNIEKVYFTYDRIISPSMIKISRKAITRWINEGTITIHPFNELKVLKESTLSDDEKEISILVKKAFSETLDIDVNKINLDDHFIYDLGGTSLDYLTLISKLRENYDLEYEIKEENYTVIDFISYINNNKIK